MDNTEILGTCDICGKDVVYGPDMTHDDPMYPTHEFDHAERRDVLYHWGCLDPALFPPPGGATA